MITEWFCFFSPKTVRTLFTIFFSQILKTVRAYCIRKTTRSVLYFEYNPRGLFLVEDCRFFKMIFTEIVIILALT